MRCKRGVWDVPLAKSNEMIMTLCWNSVSMWGCGKRKIYKHMGKDIPL